MGGCVGTSRDGAMHSGESSDISGTLGHSKPLKPRKPKWKSDVRLTEAQLQSKRDEFWDTAPAFEGRKEIWDALKASSCALESGDHQLAQAILDGANITLPNGTLLECYDELGNRYQLPVYVLSAPINMLKEGSEFDSSVTTDELTSPPAPGVEVPIRLHLSTGKDFKLTVKSSDTILSVKRQIHALEGVEPSRQRLFFSGRQLADKLRVDDAKIHKGYTLQVIVSEPPPPPPPQPSLPHLPVVATALISVPPPTTPAPPTIASVPPSVVPAPSIIPAMDANDIVTILTDQ